MDENRDFKGVWIPKDVWLDTRLNALDKVILIEIDSLDQGEKGCYASNEHLAVFCQCSERKVSEAISKLIKCGYVYVQNFDGRKRELRSRLSNSARQTSKNCEADTQNLLESNTDSKTFNNTDNKESKKEEPKKKRKKNELSYDEQITAYTENEELQSALKAFIQMRSMIKKPLTDYAMRLMLNNLNKLTSDDNTKVAILNQSIMHNWQGVFPLKNGYTEPQKQQEQPKQQESKDDNFFDENGNFDPDKYNAYYGYHD